MREWIWDEYVCAEEKERGEEDGCGLVGFERMCVKEVWRV
jgi:hypothetical protein